MTDVVDRSCFSCGATSRELVERELATTPARDVWLCAECAATFAAASLTTAVPSDFAWTLAPALPGDKSADMGLTGPFTAHPTAGSPTG